MVWISHSPALGFIQSTQHIQEMLALGSNHWNENDILVQMLWPPKNQQLTNGFLHWALVSVFQMPTYTDRQWHSLTMVQ